MSAPAVDIRRKVLAETLRAALLDQPVNVMLRRHGGIMPAHTMESWLRVADTAIKLLAPDMHPALALARRGDPLQADVGARAKLHFANSPPGSVVKSDQDGMKFCNQCDRRIDARGEDACVSKFCSLRK